MTRMQNDANSVAFSHSKPMLRIFNSAERVAGTRLEQGTLSDADEIVRTHKETFERSRYYNERRVTTWNLAYNIDLWQFALATSGFANALRRSRSSV